MDEIKASVQTSASPEKVWDIVSDLERETKFWSNISSSRTLSTEGNTVKREITVGKGDRCLQTVTLYPKEKIHAEFTKGIINGTKITTLTPRDGGTFLEIVWNVKFSGMMGFMKGKIIGSFQQQTEDAVLNIKDEAEGVQRPSLNMEDRVHWADKFDSKK